MPSSAGKKRKTVWVLQVEEDAPTFCLQLLERLVVGEVLFLFFFFNDTATTEIYTLSLHDALPISRRSRPETIARCDAPCSWPCSRSGCSRSRPPRREIGKHTSELQSHSDLVC